MIDVVGLRMNEESEITEICAICGSAHSTTLCDHAVITNIVLNASTSPRAQLSLPEDFLLHILADRRSRIVTTKFIPKGTRFGPIEAMKTITWNPSSQFQLKIFPFGEENFLEYFLDTTNEEISNWMIYIEKAENYEEQNLICYQEEEYIYYLSIKDIQENQSLKVWYAPHYARKMNKDLLEDISLNITTPLIDLDQLVKSKKNVPQVDCWSCKFCCSTFMKITEFANHLIKEHYKQQNRKKCRQCDSNFKSPLEVCQHLRKNQYSKKKLTKNSTFAEQNYCKESSIGDPLLDGIILPENVDTDFIIPTMGEDTQMVGVENINIEDLLMPENFREMDYFNFEIEESTEEEILCDICAKSFSKLKNLIQHLKGHRGDHYCSSCNKVFSRKENLCHHSCNANLIISCSSCDRTFSGKKNYKRHVDQVHNHKYECDECHKNYSNKYELDQHVCKRPLNLFVCGTCQKIFTSQRYLKKHVARHKAIITFICEVCSKGYTTKFAYELHALTHKNPRHKCDICQKEFHRKDILKKHVLDIHTEQVEVCDICNKTFKSKRYLIDHRKTHENIKFECHICKASFKTKSNLTRHIKTCSKKQDIQNPAISTLQCEYCKKRFKLQSSLVRHILRKHAVQRETLEEAPPEKGVLQFLNNDLDLITDSQDNIDLLNDEEIDEVGRKQIQVIDNILLKKSEEILGINNYISNPTDNITVENKGMEVDENIENREVFLSMPDLMDIENDIILGGDDSWLILQ